MKFDYEVETRFSFDCKDMIFNLFPPFKNLYFSKIKWNTYILNEKLFLSDRQLRFSNVILNNKNYIYLGYKDKDIGHFCNIRSEIDEQITDFDIFCKESIILNQILKKKNNKKSKKINFNLSPIENIDSNLLDRISLIYDIEKFLYFEGESEVSSIELNKILNKEKIFQILMDNKFTDNNLIDNNIVDSKKIKKRIDESYGLINLNTDELKLNLKIMYCSYIDYPLLLEIELISKEKRLAFLYEKIIKNIVEYYDLSNFMIKKEPPVLLFEKNKKIYF